MTIMATVTRLGFNRVTKGRLVRYKVGDKLEVSDLELKRFADRLEPVDDVALSSTPPRHANRDLRNFDVESLSESDKASPSSELDGADDEESATEFSSAADSDSSDRVAFDREVELERAQRVERIKAAGDVQALRMLAFEFDIDVNNRWKEDKLRSVLLEQVGKA